MPEERSLHADEFEELQEAADAVQMDDILDLHEILELASSGQVELPDDTVFALGAWWGEEIRRLTGWTWVDLRLGEGLEAPALVSEDRGVATLPLQWVQAIAAGDKENNVRAIWQRLKDGQRPSGEPRSYALVD